MYSSTYERFTSDLTIDGFGRVIVNNNEASITSPAIIPELIILDWKNPSSDGIPKESNNTTIKNWTTKNETKHNNPKYKNFKRILKFARVTIATDKKKTRKRMWMCAGGINWIGLKEEPIKRSPPTYVEGILKNWKRS